MLTCGACDVTQLYKVLILQTSLKMGFIRQIISEGGNRLFPYIYFGGAKRDFCTESSSFLEATAVLKTIFSKFADTSAFVNTCLQYLALGTTRSGWPVRCVITTAVLCLYCTALCAEKKKIKYIIK